ncbi:MAG TPA: hypothetical protein DD417_04490 [Elusimicrobia bacterium]|nr:hypothetical protein [Elusimicrobiota bacterium]
MEPLGHAAEAQPASDLSTEVFAVNLDRAGPEGDLTPASRPPWTALRPEALREDFLRVVYGREVRAWMLALVLALTLLEFLLSRPFRERKHRSGGAP